MTLHKCHADNVRRRNVTALVERDELLVFGGACSKHHDLLPRAPGDATLQVAAVDGHAVLCSWHASDAVLMVAAAMLVMRVRYYQMRIQR